MSEKTFSRRDVIKFSLAGLISLTTTGKLLEAGEQATGSTPIFGSAFTYQGLLQVNNSAANGVFNCQLKVFDEDQGGNQIGGTVEKTIAIINGQFNIVPDFGADVFTGPKRYLDVAIRPDGSNQDYTVLTPRQEITPTPYALHSYSANALHAADGDPTHIVIVSNEGNVGINNRFPGELLHMGDGNLLIEGGGETAIKIKRNTIITGGPSGDSPRPIFQWGRIIQAGDGDPEIRLMYSDDITNERAVCEIDRKGIIASVKQGVGSHFEGFISGTSPEPIFRLNSWPAMRLEMGDGIGAVDVAVERTAEETLTLKTGNNERLRVDSGGNVGIGTTNPIDRLHVNGNIRVENGSVIVDGIPLNVPDYVFEKGYQLMPLDKLQSYIDREKHLPEVPNAREIEEKALNLGEFQMILLKKIEELTLYTLAQHREIQELKEEISKLKQ